MPTENIASVRDRRGHHDRPPVDCAGVPTLPDWVLDKIKRKEDLTEEEAELARPALDAATRELASRVDVFQARKREHVAEARKLRYLRAKRLAAAKPQSRMLSDLADYLAEVD
jgi:hypothetical protein